MLRHIMAHPILQHRLLAVSGYAIYFDHQLLISLAPALLQTILMKHRILQHRPHGINPHPHARNPRHPHQPPSNPGIPKKRHRITAPIPPVTVMRKQMLIKTHPQLALPQTNHLGILRHPQPAGLVKLQQPHLIPYHLRRPNSRTIVQP